MTGDWDNNYETCVPVRMVTLARDRKPARSGRLQPELRACVLLWPFWRQLFHKVARWATHTHSRSQERSGWIDSVSTRTEEPNTATIIMPHLPPEVLGKRQAKNLAYKEIRRIAQDVTSAEVEQCQLFTQALENTLPVFDSSEVVTGKVLGRGGFCVAYEIGQIRLSAAPSEAVRVACQTGKKNRAAPRVDGHTTREMLARGIYHRTGKYVLKRVEPSLFQTDPLTYLKGIIDLSFETKFLAALDHQHILGIRGVSSTHLKPNKASAEPESDRDDTSDTSETARPYYPRNKKEAGDDYFIIVDRLSETLSKRLTAWMHRQRGTEGITGALTGGRRKKKDLYIDRILVMYDIASTMLYLHSKNIVYRDLKPDNIGFDDEGVLKIFDFGLAKELRQSEAVSSDDDQETLYRMTGLTGGIRYMAPEVGLQKPYNRKADVYSFSMIVWFALALEPPFGIYTPNMFVDRVFRKQYRPAVNEQKWSQNMIALLRSCWSDRISDRPTFSTIKEILRQEMNSIEPQIAAFMEAEMSARLSQRSQRSR
jgi:serine/threonine protein kinase